MPTYNAPNLKEDARKVFDVLKKGGAAIVPMNVGYGIIAADSDALARIFHAKKRKPYKRHAMIGSYSLHCDIHVLPSREAKIVKLLTVDLDLPIGVVAPYRTDHPMIR
jgi:tRNA A37 threonylcarbamoyladenosine synthetase subunit TsaC/SUA5/YrdC